MPAFKTRRRYSRPSQQIAADSFVLYHPAGMIEIMCLRSRADYRHNGAWVPKLSRKLNMSTYLLVHGAWHTGDELESLAEAIRLAGHVVHTPTLKGNRPGDVKSIGLAEAIESIIEFVDEHELEDIVLVGHSYGGMIITAVADRLPHRIRRLVYWNAFVPNDGESVFDMLTSHQIALFNASAAERGDGSVMLPFRVWRDALINDVDHDALVCAPGQLVTHTW